MNFQKELNERVEQTEKLIRGYLPREEGFAKTMAEAMNYSMCAGGKRLRPILLLEAFRLFHPQETGSPQEYLQDTRSAVSRQGESLAWTDPDERLAYPFMAAIEMIHTHSLIHDDLPALDNDDYRRGKLTTHKVYGEAMGVLSGVALLNYAYETMLGAFALASENGFANAGPRISRAMSVMADKTGISGMLGGQSVDVENDGKPLSKETLDYIYRHKTSALIEAPMMAGAILAGAEEAQISVIEEAAGKLGLAFQIRDDILDVTSTSRELGKPVHSDEKNHKVTYVTLFGIEEASRMSEQLSQETLELLGSLGKQNRFLEELVRSLIHRKK